MHLKGKNEIKSCFISENVNISQFQKYKLPGIIINTMLAFDKYIKTIAEVFNFIKKRDSGTSKVPGEW